MHFNRSITRRLQAQLISTKPGRLTVSCISSKRGVAHASSFRASRARCQDAHKTSILRRIPNVPLFARSFGTQTALSVFTPPAVFIGLVVALWAYKCVMMVIFQDKIIYMPSVPPFSRRETIASHLKACGSIQWREEELRSTDGTRLALCTSETTIKTASADYKEDACEHLIVVYFQGYVFVCAYSPRPTLY